MGNILPDIGRKFKGFWATKYIIPNYRVHQQIEDSVMAIHISVPKEQVVDFRERRNITELAFFGSIGGIWS